MFRLWAKRQTRDYDSIGLFCQNIFKHKVLASLNFVSGSLKSTQIFQVAYHVKEAA